VIALTSLTQKNAFDGRKKLTANTAEEDRALVFNPSNVPTGIETADMLSSFYSKAFRLSAKEERDVAPVAGN